MPEGFHVLQVAAIVQETRDARSFVLEVSRSLRNVFRYRAGQFLTFEVPWNDMRLRRCYSLSSAPETDARLQVTVKRVTGGRVSNWFNDALEVGDSILAQPPEGRFVLPQEPGTREVLLFAGGSGITPVLSLIKATLSGSDRKVKLVYANRAEHSIIFKRELERWQRELPSQLEVVHHLDSEGGLLSARKMREHIVGWENAEVFVCGPAGFMEAAQEACAASGIDPSQVKLERFVSPLDPDRLEQTLATLGAEQTAGRPAAFRMRLEGRFHQVPYESGLTLLQSAVKAGHKPPSSCEDGYCGCCMALLKRGEVAMQTHEALEPEDLERGWILACQARPTGNEPVEVDFDADY